MKTVFILLISVIPLLNSAACQSKFEEETIAQNGMETPKDTQQITITVSSKIFTATLIKSATTEAFKALLPLTIKMNELNANEKYCNLPESLPKNASNPKAIQNGDLMLYGSSTLVLFYEPLNTTYSYTKLGEIDNPQGLADALGLASATLKFELKLSADINETMGN